jgi:hypothetical protein
MITFNELDGTEVAAVLRNRFDDFLKTVPYFQKHITLPRCRVTLHVKLETYADQPQPDIIPLGDRFEVIIERPHDPVDVIEAETSDSSAPIPGGHPPDEIRELHGLPITQPMRGRKEINGQFVVADQPMLDGREVEGMPGVKISRTGSGMIDGMPTSENATVIKMDPGPAGLRNGIMNRSPMRYGGSNK